jgi:hypothetical protein
MKGNDEVAAWERADRPSILYAQEPKSFLAQYLRAILPYVLDPRRILARDRDIENEEQFWSYARRDDPCNVVRLDDYTLSDWFPRTPGVYWSDDAERAREDVYSDQGYSDPQLGQYYEPVAKAALIENGGIGSIRLIPRKIDSDFYCFATALVGEYGHGGIPLAIPRDLLERSGATWGERVNIVGRTRYLQEAGLNDTAAGVHGCSPLIVFVEKLGRADILRRDRRDVVITPVVLFEKPLEYPNWDGSTTSLNYTFVHCVSGDDQRLDGAANWIQKYAAKFEGRVLTNFDERSPRLANAPLSYQGLVTRNYERSIVQQYFGPMWVDRIDKLYKEVHVRDISVGGNAIINIDSTFENVTQTIGSANGLESAQKSELEQLVKTLKAELDKIKDSHPDETQIITSALQTATNSATRPPEQRKKSILQVSADGLVNAAKTVSEIAPALLNTATLIARFIVGL